MHKGPSENIMLSKVKSRERIDPIASTITAHAKAMIPATKKGTSVYENRGVLIL